MQVSRSDGLNERQQTAEELQGLVLKSVISGMLCHKQLAEFSIELILLRMALYEYGQECSWTRFLKQYAYLKIALPHVELRGHLAVKQFSELLARFGPHHPVMQKKW